MDTRELEYVALVYQIPVDTVGRRDTFSTDAENKSAVWCSSMVIDGEVVKLSRNSSEVWVPIAAVREMRPKGAAKLKAVAEAAPRPIGRIAVVVPVPMPEETTPELPETVERKRKPGRPRKE